MSVAGAVMGGVSAVTGLAGASSKASAQRKQIAEQVRVVETQRTLNRLEAASQRQTLELDDQRQRQLLAQQQAVALTENDVQDQQARLQQTQAQIDTDRENVLNQQRVFQRTAAANQQAAQVFKQVTQQSSQQEQQYKEGLAQQAQQENAMVGSQASGGLSKEAAADRLVLAIQNGQIDAQTLYDQNVQQELQQLGYEYNIADIEKRLGQSSVDYQQRDLGRVGELTSNQSNANRNNIDVQSRRNTASMDYGLATNRSSLAQAEASSEANTNAQVSSLNYQRKMAAGPSVFDWVTTLGNAGLSVYAASKPQQQQPQNNNYVFSDTQRRNVGPGTPSYIPTDGAPSPMPQALGSGVQEPPFVPYERVFTRPNAAYGTGQRLSTSVFKRY
jgi:hypothetical protein